MGFFDMLFGGSNFSEYVEQAKENGATLVDVRSEGEFANGHIEGAINIPLNSFHRASKKLRDKDATIYIYCASGSRSGSAANALKSMGYTDVTNIGGIGFYRGAVVAGK
ncbi:MAG: rhodanese-like domain-containing protein [Eggerthellaceae bacterium]|nr:rhodanese-like domain-containing protein [Eggerthellaceae bacterium]